MAKLQIGSYFHGSDFTAQSGLRIKTVILNRDIMKSKMLCNEVTKLKMRDARMPTCRQASCASTCSYPNSGYRFKRSGNTRLRFFSSKDFNLQLRIFCNKECQLASPFRNVNEERNGIFFKTHAGIFILIM